MDDQIGIANAYATNMKQVVDNFADLSHERARRSGSLQDKLNDQYLRFVEDQHVLVMRMAGNHTTYDNLMAAGEIDTTAQGAMANNLANQMRSIAFEAVQAAMAQTAQTSAAAQGTTGVAQGAMQTGAAGVNVALLANMTEVMAAIGASLVNVESALKVILVKVAGEEVTAEKPV